MWVVGYRLGCALQIRQPVAVLTSPVALNIWWIAHVPRVIPQQPSSVARGEALGADSIKDGAQSAPAQATPHNPQTVPRQHEGQPLTLHLYFNSNLKLILKLTLTLATTPALA